MNTTPILAELTSTRYYDVRRELFDEAGDDDHYQQTGVTYAISQSSDPERWCKEEKCPPYAVIVVLPNAPKGNELEGNEHERIAPKHLSNLVEVFYLYFFSVDGEPTHELSPNMRVYRYTICVNEHNLPAFGDVIGPQCFNLVKSNDDWSFTTYDLTSSSLRLYFHSELFTSNDLESQQQNTEQAKTQGIRALNYIYDGENVGQSGAPTYFEDKFVEVTDEEVRQDISEKIFDPDSVETILDTICEHSSRMKLTFEELLGTKNEQTSAEGTHKGSAGPSGSGIKRDAPTTSSSPDDTGPSKKSKTQESSSTQGLQISARYYCKRCKRRVQRYRIEKHHSTCDSREKLYCCPRCSEGFFGKSAWMKEAKRHGIKDKELNDLEDDYEKWLVSDHPIPELRS